MARRSPALVLLFAIVLSAGAAAPAAAEDTVVTASRAEYNAALTAFRVNRAAISGCARDPWSAGCPAVSTVVASLTELACASEVDPGELTLTSSRQAAVSCPDPPSVPYGVEISELKASSTRDHGNGAACGIRVNGPQRVWNGSTDQDIMRGRTHNHCLSGQGVTRMEAYVTLQRERLDGEEGWTNLDSDAATPINGAGSQTTPYATWDCRHTRSLLYRVEGLTYATVRGRGYVGVQRHTDSLTCPD